MIGKLNFLAYDVPHNEIIPELPIGVYSMDQKELSEDELNQMISDATVDCYDEIEEFMGVLYTLQGSMTFPFKAMALGETVEVIGIDDEKSSRGRGIVAEVRKQGNRYTIGLGELETEPDSKNSKWFQMFHYWSNTY